MRITNLYTSFLKIRRALQIASIVWGYIWREGLLHSPAGKYIRRKRIKAQKEVYTTQQRLRFTIEALGPTYIKFGQILADRPDVISERFRKELKKLQSCAKPFDDQFAIKIIEDELRQPVDIIFAEFDRNCLASASIGQVYKAVLQNGAKVIVKVRRPNIEQKIKLDLYLMHYLADRFARKYPEMAALNIVAVVDEFGESITKELDYYNEASNTIRFAEMFKGSTTTYIPHVYLEYTTKRVMVQERIIGITPDNIDALREAGLDPRQIAINGAEALLTMILRHGFFHADPHPGNMFIMPGNVIGLIDFGMVGVLRPRDMDFLANMALSFLRRDEVGVADALIKLCNVRFFENREDLIFDIRQIVQSYVHLPIEKLDFAKFMQQCISLLTEYGLKIPGGIFMLAKALATIQKVAENLDPDIPFNQLIRPYAKDVLVKKFSPKRLANQVYDVVKSYASLAKTFPDDVSEILYRLKQGEIKHNIKFNNESRLMQTIRNVSYRLAYAILLVGLFIGGIMMHQTNFDIQYSNFLLWTTSILMFLMIIRWIFRKE